MDSRVGVCAAAVAVLGMLCAAPARADEEIPAYKVLGCENNCPVFVPAVPINKPAPVYPSRDLGTFGVYVEAIVDIRYTIAADGTVKNAKIERLIGPPEFGDNALDAVNARTFRPATENGQPVEQNTSVRFAFAVSTEEQGARDTVASGYRAAMALEDDNKPDEAIAALKAIVGEQRLNFYERSMVALALSQIYLTRHDYRNALEQICYATLEDGRFLEPRVREKAIRARIELEAQAGELADAFLWFENLKKLTTVADDDPVAKLVTKLHTTLNSNAPLTLNAMVPADSSVWQHTLLRRSFDFSNIRGDLKGFEVICRSHGIKSDLNDKAQWTLPTSWSSCAIFVSGTPGAIFNFNESVPPEAVDNQGASPPKS